MISVNIEVSWANAEQTIVLIKAVNKWTWDDFFASRDVMKAMMEGVEYQVDMIIDGGTFGLPPNALSHFRRHTWDHDPRMRRIVLVAHQAFLRAMYHMYTTVIRKGQPQRLLMVTTIEEAMEKLEQQAEA